MNDDAKPFALRNPISTQQAERDGHAQGPSVSDAEEMLYGSEAGVIRLLGISATAAEHAANVAIRSRSEFPAAGDLPERPFANEAEVDNLDKIVAETREVAIKARAAFRNAAARTTEAFRYEPAFEMSGSSMFQATPPPTDPGVPTN